MTTLRSNPRQRQARDGRLSDQDKAAIAEAYLAHKKAKNGSLDASDHDAANAVMAADVSRDVVDSIDAITGEITTRCPVELTEAIAKVRAAKARLALQTENAGQGRSHPTDPTPERIAKSANGIVSEVVIPGSGPVQDTNRHRIVDYVGKIRKDLSDEEISVLEWVVDLAEAHVNVNMTINYSGSSGGGHPGRKLGGLGNVPQAVRDKHTLFCMIERTMHPGFVKTLRDLVLQLRFDDRPVAPNDFAALLFPLHKDKSFRSGVSETAVKLLAWRLIEIQWRERALTSSVKGDRKVVSITTEPSK